MENEIFTINTTTVKSKNPNYSSTVKVSHLDCLFDECFRMMLVNHGHKELKNMVSNKLKAFSKKEVNNIRKQFGFDIVRPKQ